MLSKRNARSGPSLMTSTGLVPTPPSPVIKRKKGVSKDSCTTTASMMVELRRSLKERGLNTTGNKAELVDRLHKCRVSGGSCSVGSLLLLWCPPLQLLLLNQIVLTVRRWVMRFQWFVAVSVRRGLTCPVVA